MWLYINHDRPELIDDPEIVEFAEAACMRLDRAALALGKPDPDLRGLELAERVEAENAVLAAFISDMRTLGPQLHDDSPAEAWLGDWSRLLSARATYANTLRRDPSASKPSVPTEDREPITSRMTTVALDCDIPLAVLDDFTPS